MCEIPKDMLPNALLKSLKSQLTVLPISGGGGLMSFGGDSEPVILYNEKANSILVPRNFGKKYLERNLFCNDFDEFYADGFPTYFDFNETKQAERPELKKKQDYLVKSAVDAFRKGEIGGCLCAPCGTGKTVVGLKVAAEVGSTTLILVHKAFLLNQWTERIQEWLGISPDEIGIVQQDRCEFKGKKVVIALIQSLLARQYPAEFYQYFGLIIADEVHRHAAATWSESIGQFYARLRLGLTATPYRKDGMWNIIDWSFGRIFAEVRGELMKPEVYQLVFKHRYHGSDYGIYFAGAMKKVFPAKLINLIADDVKRNKALLKIIEQAVEKDRKVLFLSDRRKHLALIYNSFVEKYGKNFPIGFYVGGMKDEQREESARKRVILGTYQMAAEGLDIPDLDVLIMGTPKSDVEQAIGRILRADDDKKTPIVIDPVDNEPYYCERILSKRNRFYSSKGWPVTRKNMG